jgi:hypothetical protein
VTEIVPGLTSGDGLTGVFLAREFFFEVDESDVFLARGITKTNSFYKDSALAGGS